MEKEVPPVEIERLLKNGSVFFNVNGLTYEAIYKQIAVLNVSFSGVDTDTLFDELCLREDLSSTAVGKGVAIPHPRYPLLKNACDEKIMVCYLDTPLDMNAPDLRPVYVMFVVLTSSQDRHLKVISQLAYVLQKTDFLSELEKKPGEQELLKLIKKFE